MNIEDEEDDDTSMIGSHYETQYGTSSPSRSVRGSLPIGKQSTDHDRELADPAEFSDRAKLVDSSPLHRRQTPPRPVTGKLPGLSSGSSIGKKGAAGEHSTRSNDSHGV